MADKLYFAYGSNINLEQMDYRCPDATVVGPVVLENYELLFRRGGFATIAPKEGGRVHGLLWSITPECERSLDLYEGYPRFYDINPPRPVGRISPRPMAKSVPLVFPPLTINWYKKWFA